MTALAQYAVILTAILAAVGMLALVLVVFPSLRQSILTLGRRRTNALAGLPSTRWGIVGMKPDDQDAASSAPQDADAEKGSADTVARDKNVAPISEDESRGFLALASLCGRVDMDASKILTQLAELLPSVVAAEGQYSCRIELVESVYWSPGYVKPAIELEAPLKVAGSQVGSIKLGTAGEHPSELNAAGQALLDAAAILASQMLERRSDRIQLDKLRGTLEQRQATIRQTARLAKIGAWEYEGATGLFRWSDEIKRIAGIDTDRAGRERERVLSMRVLPIVEESIAKGKTINSEFDCAMPNGHTLCLHAVGDVERAGAKGSRIVGIMRDVTEDRSALGRLRHIANHDVLTELPNRRYFQERIEATLRERGAKGALLIIDIDRFKDLNDASGHDVGDMLLRDFGRRLQEAAEGAFSARLGGDEFAVLLPIAERMQAEYVARAMIADLTGPLVVFGRSATVQVSAGLAIFPADGRSATELLKSADLALYEAKKRGRNMLMTYTEEIRRESEERIRIRAEVRETLPEKQFIPYYQPKIWLETGEIAGFEALIRWDHPSGIRSPGSFLPAFDDPELSRALCAAMLDHIIADMARWQTKGVPFGRIAFNASSSEFSGFDLAGHLTWRLKAIGLPPSYLGVEVTEAVFLDGAATSIAATLGQLKAAGIEIALDDFGTGFASLTHLQDFPVDVIKIDQSFVRRLVTDADSRAITTAVLSLGKSLGKIVVAEGVETAEQALLLRAARCDQVQGFYFARPMPADNVPKFIANWRGAERMNALERDAA